MSRKKIFVSNRHQLEQEAKILRTALSSISGGYSQVARKLLFHDNIPLKRMYQKVYRIFDRLIITEEEFTKRVFKHAKDVIQEQQEVIQRIRASEQKDKKCD